MRYPKKTPLLFFFAKPYKEDKNVNKPLAIRVHILADRDNYTVKKLKVIIRKEYKYVKIVYLSIAS